MSEVAAHLTDAWPLACSVCDAGLLRKSNSLTCPNGHTFDVAREGYVNLLAPRDFERGIAGDTAEMLQARRRFLDSGAYAPLRDAVCEEIARAPTATGGGRACVVEAGCGEGYCLGHAASLHPVVAGSPVRYIGFDISKAAVRMAARRYGAATFAVANIRRRLYVQSGTANVILSIFAPRNVAEFARILRPDGCVLVVLPGPAHLQSLRELYGLLSIEDLKEQRVLSQFADFEVTSRRPVEFPLSLSPAQVRDLMTMGPNAWHVRADPAAAWATGTLASFVILTLQRARHHGAAS